MVKIKYPWCVAERWPTAHNVFAANFNAAFVRVNAALQNNTKKEREREYDMLLSSIVAISFFVFGHNSQSICSMQRISAHGVDHIVRMYSVESTW